MSGQKKNSDESFMIKLSTMIVDKRNLIFLIMLIAIIFSLFSKNWVSVENALSAFLPDSSSTKAALDIMDEQFTTFGTAEVMVENITNSEAHDLYDALVEIEGVQGITFDDTTDHYAKMSALYSITFNYSEKDDRCLDVLEEVKQYLSSYDIYVVTALGDAAAEIIDKEVSVIIIYVAIIVLVVLTLTSSTYAEVPVLIITFVVAMVLNSGTNFLFGTISFVSNSVTSILQLALSMDYTVILCNRYKEEHEKLPTREATIVALSKAIPEISASSLTTIGGLVAMMFMQFKIGPDMGICLIKSILYALLCTFLLMPGLLVLFGPLMDKTKHRIFVPKIPFVGKFDYATRKIVPPLFVVAICFAFYFSNNLPYAYGYGGLETPKHNETQIAEMKVKDTFTSKNMLALVVPGRDYTTEKKLINKLESYSEVDNCMGLANIEAMDGYCLADKLTARQFSELAGLDYEVSQLLYTAYAADNEEYGKVLGGIANYSVPLMDIFKFAYDMVDEGYVTLDAEVKEKLDDANEQMTNGRLQLQSDSYDRILIYLNLPEGGDETYAFLNTITSIAQSFYPGETVYLAGNSTSEYDFKLSFDVDNLVVSILSILIVLVVLLFTFMSAGMPVLLILVIQGAIWLNFTMPALYGDKVFFMSYLIVSSIQMGANIDYAIVISSRFNDLKNTMSKKDAIIETMNFAFPTIITSGTILAVAGVLIGKMTSEPAICGIGEALGRGTLISIFLVMFVLPQILLLGEKIIDKTKFSMPSRAVQLNSVGRTRIDGMVRGEINGTFIGVANGIVEGSVNVNLIAGTAKNEAEGLMEVGPQLIDLKGHNNDDKEGK